MSGEFLQQKQVAVWNYQLKYWQTLETDLFSQVCKPFLATWPLSGMTVNGVACELPTLVQHTPVSASSLWPVVNTDNLFRTPSVTDSTGGAISEKQARERVRMVKLADQVAELAFFNGEPVTAAITKSLTEDGQPEIVRNSDGTWNWGKFEPAVRRWEMIIGRPAPEPTEPTGNGGTHRLSANFSEWLMGLPAGWVTDCGLTRAEALKACGNGVVPQAAEFALRLLLDDANSEQQNERTK